FGIDQDQPPLGGQFRPSFEQSMRVLLELSIMGSVDDSLPDNLLPGNILVVTGGRFGGGRNDGPGQGIVLLQAVGQRNSAELPFSGAVFPPGVSGKITANDHFNRKGFAFESNANVGIGDGNDPVGYDVGRRIQEFSRNLVQHLAFERNGFGQNHIKGRNPVAGHHDQQFVVDRVYVADFSVVQRSLSRK